MKFSLAAWSVRKFLNTDLLVLFNCMKNKSTQQFKNFMGLTLTLKNER